MALLITKGRGTPGVNLTQGAGGNTGLLGDDYADLISPNNTTAVRYSDDIPNPLTAEGTTIRIEAASGSTLQAYRWDEADFTALTTQLVAVFTDVPAGGASDFVQMRGTQQNAKYRMKADGVVGISNATGSSSATTDTEFNAVPHFGHPVVIDTVVVPGTTTGNGRIAIRARRLDNLTGTPLVDHDASTYDVGTAAMNSIRLMGSHTGTIRMAPYYVLSFAADTGRAAFLPDPELYAEPSTPPYRFYWDGTTARETVRYYYDGTTATPL